VLANILAGPLVELAPTLARLVRPNGSWSREALLLVPLTDVRMNGTTAEAGNPTNPTGNIDLYR
jgi:hypothetical protein